MRAAHTRAMALQAVIGLEVHAQLLTKTKLFCGCLAAYGAAPNTHICPTCLGMPGALPVPNARAIELAVIAGTALGCQIRQTSRFARKSYFYPDLAKGYQISQFELPIDEAGKLDVRGEDPVSVRIQRIHIEEDAAKNLHGVSGATVVDFNRAGVPLIEIVTEPDLRSGVQAEAYLRQLRETLMFVAVNDGNLEEGSFRCDANVSVCPEGSEVLGTRVELKNINSFRFVRKAIEHEIARQKALVQSGQAVVQETRHWNDDQGRSESMRGKEEAHDYRYFPDPDLPPLVVPASRIAEIQASMHELPDALRGRWRQELGLTEYDSTVLSGHPVLARFFDDVVQKVGKSLAKRVANFIQSEVLRHVETAGLEAVLPVSVEHLAELIELERAGTINGKIAKELMARMIETGDPPALIVERESLAQVTDSSAIEAEVQKVIDASPAQVAQYKAGKTALVGYFVGQVMKATKGQANPKLVNETLRRLLG